MTPVLVTAIHAQTQDQSICNNHLPKFQIPLHPRCLTPRTSNLLLLPHLTTDNARIQTFYHLFTFPRNSTSSILFPHDPYLTIPFQFAEAMSSALTIFRSFKPHLVH